MNNSAALNVHYSPIELPRITESGPSLPRLMEAQMTLLHQSNSGTILDGAQLLHGPVSSIGRYLLFADQCCRAAGVTLTYSTPHELLTANNANRDTWLPLFTGVNPDFHSFSNNFICLVVVDKNGSIVGTSAARRYDWPNSNLHVEAQALRFAYECPDKHRQPQEECRVTAIAAKGIDGVPTCLGGAWYHPSLRGSGLSAILPRASRLIAYSRWQTNCIFAIMSRRLIDSGFAKRLGYPCVEYGIDFINSPAGSIQFGLLWMKPDDMFSDLEHQLELATAASTPTLKTTSDRSGS